MEVGRHLIGSEAQVSCPQLDQLAACSQTCQWQVGISAGDEDDVQVGRKVVEQVRHPVRDVGAVGEVVVVEHQIDVDRLGADLIDQCRQQAVCRWVTGLKQRLESTTYVRQHGLKRCDDV